jgi:hypothetical protein
MTEPNPTFTFARSGTYTASLTVTDPQGAHAAAQVQIAAGNEPPKVDVELVRSNRSFFFPGVPIRYAVRVSDREDGSLASGRIPARRVAVTAEYLKEGLPSGEAAAERRDTASLPTRGAYTPPAGSDSAPQGVVVLRASYTDRGAKGLPGITAEKEVVLRAPTVVVASGDVSEGVQKYKGSEVPVEVAIASRSGASVRFKQLDLTDVSAIVFAALAPVPQLNGAGGKVEVRLDSASGVLVGETEVIQPQATLGPPVQLRAALRPAADARPLRGHDVYFVFRNEQAAREQNLFVLLTATFESAASARATTTGR